MDLSNIHIPQEFAPYLEGLLKNIGKSLGEKIWNKSKDEYISADIFGKAKENYIHYIRNDIGLVQVLGMRRSVRLEDLFIETRVFKSDEVYIKSFETLGTENLLYGRRQKHTLENTVNFYSLFSLVGHHRIMLLGDPGAGKSTSLRAIALSGIVDSKRLANIRREDKFPIYIELRRYAEILENTDMGIDEYFDSVFNQPNFHLVVHSLYSKGNCIFLLDAFDEVPKSQQGRVADQIKSLELKYSLCQFVVSSRIGNFKTIKGFDIYEIADFNDIDRRKFVKNWFRLSGQQGKADDLISEIKREAGISEITTNPLLLSLLCLLYSKDLEIPKRKSHLYDRCVQILLREWDTDRSIKRTTDLIGFSVEIKLALLSEIARFFMMRHERYFRAIDIYKLVKSLLDKYELDSNEPEKFIEEIFSQHGLIVKIGNEMYGFSHLTFQEYLTAKYYARNNNINELLNKYSIDDSWRQVVNLTAGEVADAASLIFKAAKHASLDNLSKHEIVTAALSNKAIISINHRRRITNILIELSRLVLGNGVCIEINADQAKALIYKAKLKNIKDLYLDENFIALEVVSDPAVVEAVAFLQIYDARERLWLRGDILVTNDNLTDRFLGVLFGNSGYNLVNIIEGQGEDSQKEYIILAYPNDNLSLGHNMEIVHLN